MKIIYSASPRASQETRIYVLKLLLSHKIDKWEIFCGISVKNICHHFLLLNMILSTMCQFPKYFRMTDTNLADCGRTIESDWTKPSIVMSLWVAWVWGWAMILSNIYHVKIYFQCLTRQKIFITRQNLPQLIRLSRGKACFISILWGLGVWESYLSP